jgi:hypothetical protein
VNQALRVDFNRRSDPTSDVGCRIRSDISVLSIFNREQVGWWIGRTQDELFHNIESCERVFDLFRSFYPI